MPALLVDMTDCALSRGLLLRLKSNIAELISI